MPKHLEIKLTCVGDYSTAIIQALKIVKAHGDDLFMSFPEGFKIRVRTESCLLDLLQIHRLNLEIEKLENQKS